MTIMTEAVTHILREVEQLSEFERRELRHAIVERVPMSEDLTEEDFAALAAASFRALDEEEKLGVPSAERSGKWTLASPKRCSLHW